MKQFSLYIAIFTITFLSSVNMMAQKDSIALQREARKFVREGNELYKKEKYTDASVAFKKALEKNARYKKASYNLGNALYQEDNFKEAVPQYELIAKTSNDKTEKAEAFHNIGNAMMKQKQYQQAVDAYKNSLRNNPEDDETRYNLAVAQKLLDKQNQNKDKDKKDNKDNKDKKNQDDKQQNKDKKDGDDKKDKKDPKKDGDKGDKDKNKDPKKDDKNQQKPKPSKGKMSPEQIKQLLESLNNEEKKTQKKLNAQKAKGKKVKQEKDW